MTSQLNVDTIVDKAGSGGTNIKVSNNAVAVAEGGSATTTVVQGLAKAWMDYKGTDTNAIYDSLNVASVADEGTGRFDPSFTNAMSSANYSITTGAVGGHVLVENAATSQTGKTFLSSGNSTFGAFVDSIVHMQICGDLA